MMPKKIYNCPKSHRILTLALSLVRSPIRKLKLSFGSSLSHGAIKERPDAVVAYGAIRGRTSMTSSLKTKHNSRQKLSYLNGIKKLTLQLDVKHVQMVLP